MSTEILRCPAVAAGKDDASPSRSSENAETGTPVCNSRPAKWWLRRRIESMVWCVPLAIIAALILSPLVPIALLMHLSKMLHGMQD